MYFIHDYLRKQFEEYSGKKLDGRKGTPTDELMVKPTGLVMQEFYDFLVQEKRINSPDKWEEWTEDEMDYFASKFYYFRTQGDKVSITVRVYFDFAEDFPIDSNVSFTDDRNLQYIPAEDELVNKSSYKKSDIDGANYYVDFLAVADSPGDQYQIDANKITGIVGASFNWKAVTNPYRSLGGSVHESNDEFWERFKYSLNSRSLNNERGIVANLKQLFPSIQSMYIAGAGDAYMNRDLVSGIPQTGNEKTSDFRGKYTESKMVKSICFQNVFPPAPGSEIADTYWGPHSVKSDYAYPLTIDAVNETINIKSSNPRESDPSFFGFPFDEISNDQYKGMYFLDITNKCMFETSDLFNLEQLDLPFTFNPNLDNSVGKIVPDESWVYGEEAYKNGTMNGLPGDVGVDDIINFTNNKITLREVGKTIMVGKDVKKFTGTKYSGKIIWTKESGNSGLDSTGKGSMLQFTLGGTNTQTCDSYSGIGFGIKSFDDWSPEEEGRPNVSIYFAMGSRYGSTTIYANSTDLDKYVDIGSINALKEKTWRFEPGVAYTFEFIINDNLSLTLIVKKDNNLDEVVPENNVFKMDLPSSVLQMFANKTDGIFYLGDNASGNSRFGSTMKISLESPNVATDLTTEPFQVTNLKVFDINPARSQFLTGIDMENIQAPFKLNLAAEGSGNSVGYQAFVWDKNKISIASSEDELTSGGWSELKDLSNPDGSKESINGMLSEQLQEYDRYVTNSRFGKKLFVLITPGGSSAPSVLYNDDEGIDVNSKISIDYINAESISALQFHSNSMANIYCNTWKNSTQIQPINQTVVKSSGEEYFEISKENEFMIPLAEIVNVSVTDSFAGRTLGKTDYSLIYPNPEDRNSGREVIRVFTHDKNIDSITVSYIPYPDIMRMQAIFNDSRFRSAFGDMLSIHKAPIVLDISFKAASDADSKQMQDLTREYIDTVVSTFSKELFQNYFFEKEINIWDINIQYNYIDNNVEVSEDLINPLTIKSVEFFKSGTINVNE